MDMSYRYKSLSSSNNQIRLLKLFPSGDPSNPVICELETVSLGYCPSYWALSYCWGDLPSSDSISLHGAPHQVSGNLYSALCHLRDKTEERFWWIDALCINQQDAEERSLQVLRMTSIYQTAHRVVAWIGPAESGQPTLESLLDGSADAIRSMMHPCYMHIDLLLDYFDPMLSRQYWRRMWMVQEIAVAYDLWVVCGNSWVQWETLCETIDTCETILRCADLDIPLLDSQNDSTWRPLLPPTSEDLFLAYQAMKTFRMFKERTRSQLPLSFLEALQRTRNSLATDKRDRVYALLGLVHDGRAYASLPDYTISFEALQAQMAKNYLQSTRNLDVILFAGNKQRILNGTIPSWTPDWLNLGFEFQYAISPSDEKFTAAGPSSYTLSASSLVDPRSIQVEYILLANIDGLSSLYGRELLGTRKKDHFVQPSSYARNPYAESIDVTNSSRRAVQRVNTESRSRTIEALFNCLDRGPGLVESWRRPYNFNSLLSEYSQVKPEMMVYLYHGAWSSAEIETFSAANFWKFLWPSWISQGKRRYDSPALRQWLEDNRDLMIHGATFESLCKSTCSRTVYPTLFTGPLWLHIVAEITLGGLIIVLILSYAEIIHCSRKGYWAIWSLILADIICLPTAITLTSLRYRNLQLHQRNFLERMDERMTQRSLRLAITGATPALNRDCGGLFAMVPGNARKGDKIAILRGCSTPVLLRECRDGYQIIGIVYQASLMERGEVKSWRKCCLY